MRSRTFRLLNGFVLSSIVLLTAGYSRASARAQGQHKDIEIRGRIACIDHAGNSVQCDDKSDRFVLRSVDGKAYRVAPNDPMASIFTDARVRERTLQLTGWVTAKGEVELIRVQSIKDGKLYDLYYFCEVCKITAYGPGLCPCCGAEMEFREVPSLDP